MEKIEDLERATEELQREGAELEAEVEAWIERSRRRIAARIKILENRLDGGDDDG